MPPLSLDGFCLEVPGRPLETTDSFLAGFSFPTYKVKNLDQMVTKFLPLRILSFPD